MNPLRIEYLADHPSHIRRLAEWHFGQWGYLNPTHDVAWRIADMESHGRHQIPTTFIALDGVTLVGSASLIEEDMDTRPELTPWLASVFVDAAHRNRGIGSALVNRVMEEAGALGVETLYLFTPDREAFYARLGWKALERTKYHGENIMIMTIKPAAMSTT